MGLFVIIFVSAFMIGFGFVVTNYLINKFLNEKENSDGREVEKVSRKTGRVAGRS